MMPVGKWLKYRTSHVRREFARVLWPPPSIRATLVDFSSLRWFRPPAVLGQSGGWIVFDESHFYSSRHACGQSQDHPGHFRVDLSMMVTKDQWRGEFAGCKLASSRRSSPKGQHCRRNDKAMINGGASIWIASVDLPLIVKKICVRTRWQLDCSLSKIRK